MKINRVIIATGFVLALSPLQFICAAVSPDEAKQIAEEAYIYGYPLVTMDMTRRQMTNVEKPTQGEGAPVGQLLRMREYPNAEFKGVTAPNADTLYTMAWMDVGKEPWVLSIPDSKDRYFLFPMLDGWTEVFDVPGKRTTGTKAQKYAITGPGWKGTLPAGLKEYKSPTSMVWLLGRIYCTGAPEDYAAVHAMQDKTSITPLSSYGKTYTPPPGKVDPTFDMKKAPRDLVNELSAQDYFDTLAKLMKDNPPTAEDAPIVEKMAKIGIAPGQDFDLSKLEPDAAKAVEEVPKAAFEKITAHFAKAGQEVNGWMFSTNTGNYGADYLNRAFITVFGLGANRPEDAIYPTSKADAKGQPYDGSKQYVLHFDSAKDLPPVNGFWSLTMYNKEMFFVENPLNRYTLSARNNLKPNPDGSTDLHIQHDSPGKDKESNWLPAPAGQFVLMFRFYWPKESLIDGSWKIPAVTEATVSSEAAGAQRESQEQEK